MNAIVIKNKFRSVSTDEFLKQCLLKSDIPYDWRVQLALRGLEHGDVYNDNCTLLAKICRYIDPLHVFEVGTGNGKFTAILARNSNALITTTALVKEYRSTYEVYEKEDLMNMEEVGRIYRINDLQTKVRQLYETPARMNLNRYYSEKEVDFALINYDIYEGFKLVWPYLRSYAVLIIRMSQEIRRIIKEFKLDIVWIKNTDWAGVIIK